MRRDDSEWSQGLDDQPTGEMPVAKVKAASVAVLSARGARHGARKDRHLVPQVDPADEVGAEVDAEVDADLAEEAVPRRGPFATAVQQPWASRRSRPGYRATPTALALDE